MSEDKIEGIGLKYHIQNNMNRIKELEKELQAWKEVAISNTQAIMKNITLIEVLRKEVNAFMEMEEEK